jgi:hypothetical protein
MFRSETTDLRAITIVRPDTVLRWHRMPGSRSASSARSCTWCRRASARRANSAGDPDRHGIPETDPTNEPRGCGPISKFWSLYAPSVKANKHGCDGTGGCALQQTLQRFLAMPAPVIGPDGQPIVPAAAAVPVPGALAQTPTLPTPPAIATQAGGCPARSRDPPSPASFPSAPRACLP